MKCNLKDIIHDTDDISTIHSHNDRTMITVKIRNLSSQEPKSVRLNISDNLLIIRQELVQDYNINDILLFLKKFSENNEKNNNDGSYEFAEIACKDEEITYLNEIIENNILYIKCKIKTDWNFLNNLRKLDYGCTMTPDEIKKANKRAFEMTNCESNRIGAEGCKKGVVEFKSNEDYMMKTNLFFSSDINVQNFVKLGMSVEVSKNESFKFENNTSYHFMKHGRISLKFNEYLKPTEEFIKEVKDAIESKDADEKVKKFKQITKEFGQFIPTEVILGGRAHFSEQVISTGHSVENSKEISANMNTEALEVKGANTSNYSKGKLYYHKYNCTKLIGGESPNSLENFDEETWVKSLKEENWDCIEFRNPISIFQLLPDNLRKQIITSVGKRIHYSTVKDFNHQLDQLEEFGKAKIFELNIPPDILDIIQNKDADCNIFATVIDTTESKNDFFTCQVLCPTCPPDKKPNPQLIIHCIQKRFKRRECKLKIGWMVIGYYTDFNFILSDFNVQLNILKNENTLNNQIMINTELLSFKYNSYIQNVPPCLGIPVLTKLDSSNDSFVIGHHFFNAQEENKIGVCTFSYCLKNKHYVNLPNFTFYTLIISNYHINDAYNIIPFDYSFRKFRKKPYINLINNNTTQSPKFISLYSTQKTNCGPIFLKQKSNQIKVKSVYCKNRTCFICKSKTLTTSENNIKCTFFDPYISDILN